ncbi:hypothetical protein [Acetilactobacillus jinshanensis]|uniref:hypothetical protein n=1 Tax=Acetilactobacillus jinshanensis TaxID=1720083 RepID=UPI0013A62FD3|nr:hypothetical protein [Acetilactobacillus jinshanensis]URL60986.1 hypothetical protein HGK75_03020 [uncultured bacterium]
MKLYKEFAYSSIQKATAALNEWCSAHAQNFTYKVVAMTYDKYGNAVILIAYKERSNN